MYWLFLNRATDSRKIKTTGMRYGRNTIRPEKNDKNFKEKVKEQLTILDCLLRITKQILNVRF